MDYKRRNMYLAAGVVIMLVFSWELSLSKTWVLYTENRMMEEQIAKYKGTPTTVRQLRNELAQINDKISKFDNTTSSQQQLLDYVSHFAKEGTLKVVEVPKTTWQKNSGFNIETNLFKVEGDYKEVLELIYNMEYKERLCKVAGAEFKKTTDMRTKKEYLMTTLYLQNIKKEKI